MRDSKFQARNKFCLNIFICRHISSCFYVGNYRSKQATQKKIVDPLFWLLCNCEYAGLIIKNYLHRTNKDMPLKSYLQCENKPRVIGPCNHIGGLLLEQYFGKTSKLVFIESIIAAIHKCVWNLKIVFFSKLVPQL